MALFPREARRRRPGANRTGCRRTAIVAAAMTLSLLILTSVIPPVPAVAAATYPAATGNVNDFAGVLSGADKANLEALANAVLDQTGTTFAVAVIKDHGDESIEMYAANLYEKWGIGAKGEDKGLLVVLSMAEHDVKAEVGYGLEGVITDRRAGECLDKMTPYFKQDQYGQGLYAGLMVAAQYVAADAGVELDVNASTPDYQRIASRPEAPSPAVVGAVAGLVGVPLLLLAFFGLRGKRCPRCKGKLVATDRIVQGATYDAGGLAMKIYTCPKCGYHNERPYRTGRLNKPYGGGMGPIGGGPFWGGLGGGKSGGGGFSGPRGFGGGRSGGGGASRKW